jgi:alpha-tubulin suppressor-like RCC1 family protein
MSREYFAQVELVQCQEHGLCAVASCGSNVCAIGKYNGTLFTWGDNSKGQLGTAEALTIGHVPNAVVYYKCDLGHKILMPPVQQIACGKKHTIIITKCNRVMVCGDNSHGQLGIGNIEGLELSVYFVDMKKMLQQYQNYDLPTVNSVHAGSYACGVITHDNRVMTWGSGLNFQLGYRAQDTPTTIGIQFLPRTVQHKVLDANGDSIKQDLLVTALSFGSDHTACISVDSDIYSWGINTCGKLGNGSRINSRVPSLVCSKETLKSIPVLISCGGYHTLLVTSNKTLWTCGSGKFGAGYGLSPKCSLFFRCIHIQGESNKDLEIIGASAGKTHSLLITDNNLVLTCGKMKSSMYMHTDNPRTVDTFDGFGGLGYFQGIASHGHVPSFKIVTQLKDTMGFGNSFSNNMIQKITIFLLGIYFDKDIETCEKFFMKLIDVELIEIIMHYIS